MLGKIKSLLKRLVNIYVKDFPDVGISKYLGQLYVNFIFKIFFFRNRECPWSVHFTSQVVGANNIRIGKNVKISFMFSGGCYIQGKNGIFIGDNTIFAPGVKIISADHNLYNYNQWLQDRPIKIGSNCWIGANAVILPGVEIGNNVVVGAGAVVTKNFSEGYCVIAGVPAEIIKTLEKDKNH